MASGVADQPLLQAADLARKPGSFAEEKDRLTGGEFLSLIPAPVREPYSPRPVRPWVARAGERAKRQARVRHA